MRMQRVLLLGIVLLGAIGCTQIDTGNVGVERSFGKINSVPQPQGVYMTILDSVDEFTTKEVSFQINDMSPKSRDNLTLKDLDVDVYYKVNPANIPGLYIKYQGDYVKHKEIVEDGSEVLVMGYGRVFRAAREATYNAVDDFDATTMHTKRAEIAEQIRLNLQKELESSDPGSFTITTINVRNLLTDPAIEKAIQQQIATDQEVVRMQKQVLVAEANADRMRAMAQGEADANAILAASLTPAILQIRLAEIERETIVESAAKGNMVINGSVTPLVTAK